MKVSTKKLISELAFNKGDRPAEIIPSNIIPFTAICEEVFYDLQGWSSYLLDDIQDKGNLFVSWYWKETQISKKQLSKVALGCLPCHSIVTSWGSYKRPHWVLCSLLEP